MSGTTSIAQTLSTLDQMIDNGPASNIQRSADKSAKRLDSSMQVDYIGGSGALRTSSILTRPSNPLQEKVYIDQVSRLAHKNAYTEILTSVQSLIAGSENSQVSRLVSSVDKLFNKAKEIVSKNDLAMRRAFIDSAERISRELTRASSGINELRLEADNRLSDGAKNANTAIKALFALNREILVGRTPITLHDKRDSLIRQIAEFFDITATFGKNGSVQIQSKTSGDYIVAPSSYAQFSYSGVGTVDEILEGDYPELTVQHFNKVGRQTRSSVFDSNNFVKKFSGGQWEAWVDLRDNVLLEANAAVKDLARNVSKEINKVHNDGSPYPPKTRFESTLEVAHDQSLDWGGEFTIFAVDKNGNQLEGGAGKLNPMKINIQTLRTANGGTPTVKDLIDEINEKIDSAPSRPRAAIGAIYDHSNHGPIPVGQVVPPTLDGEYLINNVQLLAHGPVGGVPNNDLTFELDLQGNSYFGSSVRVVSVQTDAAAGGGGAFGPPAVVPAQPFRLEQGSNAATGQAITVSNAAPGRRINVEIEVTGDNGVVNTGIVSFRVPPYVGNPNNVTMNTRISYDATLANSLTDDFAHPGINLTSHTSLGNARLVRANGTTIDPNSGEVGKLVIETGNPDYRLVIQGGGFGAQFGFNNLFEFDERTGELAVNQDIANDVSQLSMGKVVEDKTQNFVTGDVAASASLSFNYGAGIINPAAGVTITANNTITINTPVGPYIFTAGPGGGQLDFAVGVNDGVTLANLVTAINNHPQLGDMVVANFDGVNVFTVTAKVPGIRGNNITLETTLSNNLGTATASITVPGGVAGPQQAVNPATNLAGGTNKNIGVSSYKIGPNSKQVLEALSNLQTVLVDVESEGILADTVSTLSGLATIVTDKLSDRLNEAQTDSDIAAEVLKKTDAEIKQYSRIKPEEEYLRVKDLFVVKTALSYLMSMMNNTDTKIHDIIFG